MSVDVKINDIFCNMFVRYVKNLICNVCTRCSLGDVCLPLHKLCDGVRNCPGIGEDESRNECQSMKKKLGTILYCWFREPWSQLLSSSVCVQYIFVLDPDYYSAIFYYYEGTNQVA